MNKVKEETKNKIIRYLRFTFILAIFVAIQIAKTLSEGDPDYEKNYSLLKWLGDANAEFSKIKMVYYNNYRGVHARCKIMVNTHTSLSHL